MLLSQNFRLCIIEYISPFLSFLVADVNGFSLKAALRCRPTMAADFGRRDGVIGRTWAPDTCAEKFESFERINSIRETNGNFDSCNSCKRLGTSRLHELHESKFPFVSRIEFIRSKLSNFSAHVSGVMDSSSGTPPPPLSAPRPTMAQLGQAGCSRDIGFTSQRLNYVQSRR